MEPNSRELAWDGCVNVRDLGGLGQIRPGAVVRMEWQDPVGTPFYAHWSELDGLASPLYYPAMLAEYPQRVVAAVRAIANAAPGCVVFHCAGGKDRTGLLALVLLTLAEATPGQLTAVQELLAARSTSIEASLTSTIASLTMPDYLLDNGLAAAELAALRARLTT
jgi:protein-tyrosine phosphatase